jgi:hypothetical protein
LEHIMSYHLGTPITIHDATTISALLDACARNSRVAWLGGRQGLMGQRDLLTGRMVSVGTQYGTHDYDSDVRACWLRVETDTRHTEYWLVSDAAARYDSGELVLDYTPDARTHGTQIGSHNIQVNTFGPEAR